MGDQLSADETRVELSSGRVVSLHRLSDQDSAAVMALHQLLPAEDRYFRFFTPRPAHLDQLVTKLTQPDAMSYAIGAFDAGRLIGVANYVVAKDDPHAAEVAIAVAHDDHRAGVGTALFKQLGRIAASHGIRCFTADVLAENNLMRQVVRDIGWPRKRLTDDAVVLRFEIELPDAT